MEPLNYTGTSSTATSTPLGLICTGTGGTPYIPTTSGTVSFNTPINFTQSTSKQIMQHKVAVFKVTRDENDKITKTEFLKELWVETKNGQSVDFQVARDKYLANYEMSELSIRTIYSISF
jgi:hypothetical protein